MSFQDLESGRLLTGRRDLGNGRQDSTQAVAAGLFQITTSVRNFERLVNTIGTQKDTPQLREKLHNSRLQIGQLVKDTSTKLKQASETDHGFGISANKKITDAKLARDFESILKEFQKLQRLSAERETSFTPRTPQVSNSRNAANEFDSHSNNTFVESRRQEVLMLDDEIIFNEAMIEEREQGIQEIQKEIGHVNEIFKDLAVLVHDQGKVIDDINSHIENSYTATSQGKDHLKKAAKSQKSNSSLMCLLLVIFGIILLIVIIVIAA